MDLITLAVTLCLLWFHLIDQLRIEWSANPQYAYGWAVPFLSLYLVWTNFRRGRALHSATLPSNNKPKLRFPSNTRPVAVAHPIPPPLACGALVLLAFAWLPVRLIQQANPEWRLVSWALALDVLGLTLLLFPWLSGSIPANANARFLAWLHRITASRRSALAFPLGFMLVAVPWPSPIEEPVIQSLSRLTAGLTCETLNLVGVPALHKGNAVEVGSGLVDIEEACSGIRSLQTALMLSIFFGGLYRLRLRRRFWLIVAAICLALALNVARTTTLALIAANCGIAAVNAWHGPAGIIAPLACFVALALLAHIAKPPAQLAQRVTVADAFTPPANEQAETKNRHSPTRFLSLALLAWVLLADLGSEAWYRLHEYTLPAPAAWSVVLPPDVVLLDQTPPSTKTKNMLRFDTAQQAIWQDAAGRTWQLIFLQWAPGHVASRIANDHTPAICLSAAGRDLVGKPQPLDLNIGGLCLRGNFYTATDYLRGKVHLFYCLRQDRSNPPSTPTQGSLWHERLQPVFQGRRNTGQRSVELAAWGFDHDAEARNALISQLKTIIVCSGAS